ncbi:hypothetical protein QC761_304240 [Podospora bellae-mahoneyi]|uniref:C2H2-type domain-containing protein n=1 Tax=Podospora bellae-mahoneyi TaxID=2093777 RepID=A0ABR0FNM5_9PEZI|nr:hypothetical protein QC761_304240 [Podospora bellae-mahoneyi]
MEGLPNGSANVINTSTASYSSQPAVSQHPIQQQHQQQHHSTGLPPQTLPPLQPSHPAMQQPPYGNYPHGSRTPSAPNTPVTNNMASYPPPPNQSAGRGAGNYPMMNNSYPTQGYPASTSTMMPNTTAAAAHPQPIAPAPSPAGARAPPVLRPMPASGMPQAGISSPYVQSPMMGQNGMLPEGGDQPTHVVGSQGRRGILPSAPGRPAAPAPGTTAKNPIPQKDADGKFPCPHCTKTYLHAKHLKRHLLRHTGDRPYMCVLCRDTFSRSDILKRHFIKCSVRRGNPTGASHLSHPQAHVKKNAAAQQKAIEGEVNHMNGMPSIPGDGMVQHPFGLISAPEAMTNMANDQNQLSRSSSINRIEDANRDRRSMTGSVMGASTRPGSFDQTYTGGDVSNNMTANINPQLANYSMPQNGTGMPFLGGQGGDQWAQMFSQEKATAAKPDPNSGSARAVGIIPGDTATDSSTFPSWGIPPSYPNAYHHLSRRIIEFLCPTSDPTNPTAQLVNHHFQPDNIRHFLEQYTNYHVHFATVHIPTFRALDAYVGLLAAMCIVGACYSDRTPPDNIREIMEVLRTSFESSSLLFRASLAQDEGFAQTYDWASNSALEEFQAIAHVQVLFTWHGTAAQRQRARRIWPLIANLARKAGLLHLSQGESSFSPLHQSSFASQNFPVSQFDWQRWVGQEARVRTMYLIFIYDAALGLYFNCGPEFTPFDLRLPLPADDAAWEASNAVECAEALGLCGPAAAERRNPDGTRRTTQPEMRMVLKALLDNNYRVLPGSTNLYGKFILIHALLDIMRQVQLEGRNAISRSSTPLPTNAWFVDAQGSSVPHGSGRTTPTDIAANLVDPQTLKTLITALDKFKANWDHDMAVQFPPSAAAYLGRYGFCRDGIHFYWLATHLLRTTRHVDLVMNPDQRFARVIHMLKSVKNWVLTDGAARGEDMGSVGDIDEAYGAVDTTLDMTQLFRRLPYTTR